jgi:CRP/FNR family transcriptional regulator, cyclic AMP receptor protein
MVLRSDALAMTRQILLRHHLFAGFTAEQLEQVFAHARIEHVKARHQIFRKGTPGLGMVVILKGRVRISSVGPDGDEVVLAHLGEGEVFGEMTLLDGKERTADATAVAECELLLIDRRDFLPFLRANPDVTLRLLALVCERLRRTTEQVEDMIFLDAEARLAKKLLALGQAEPRRKSALPQHMTVTVSQRELGIMIGLTRESINKQLSAWHREGIIKVEGGAIVVLDEAALRAYAEPV